MMTYDYNEMQLYVTQLMNERETRLQPPDTKVATLQAKDTSSEGQKVATLQAKDTTLHVSGVQSTRMTREKLQELILEFCTDWRSAEEIAIHVHRNKQYIRGEILPGMDHLLIRKYPLKEKHPGQKYKVKE